MFLSNKFQATAVFCSLTLSAGIDQQCIGHVARIGERRSAYRALVEKPEGRRPLGRPRHRWEDTIKMDLREVGLGGAWTGSI
jgi:hypothetical protein